LVEFFVYNHNHKEEKLKQPQLTGFQNALHLLFLATFPSIVLTQEELDNLKRSQAFQKSETGYQKIQGTKVLFPVLFNFPVFHLPHILSLT